MPGCRRDILRSIAVGSLVAASPEGIQHMEGRYRPEQQPSPDTDQTIRAQTWVIVICMTLPVPVALALWINGAVSAWEMIPIAGVGWGLQRTYHLMLRWLQG